MPGKHRRWKLVWSDEFDGGEIDPTKWDFELGNGFFDYKNHQWVPGWGNEELQYYTREPENVSVRDSLLYIRALKEPLHGCGYTSARIRTRLTAAHTDEHLERAVATLDRVGRELGLIAG